LSSVSESTGSEFVAPSVIQTRTLNTSFVKTTIPNNLSNTTAPSTQNFLDSKKTFQERSSREEYVLPPEDVLNFSQKHETFPKKTFWFLIVVAILVLLFSISFFFVSAQVEIVPKSENANIQSTLVAKKTPQAGELGYNVIVLSKESGKVVDAEEEEAIEKKASGRIIIFNKYSRGTQRLVANTRFETPSGLIYRIAEAVTVPGYTTKGVETVPGSITVTVFSDKAGEAYNTSLSDFTIPGFEGDPRFNTIYARSETVMQGGFSGVVKKVSAETLSSAKNTMRGELEAELTREASLQIPESYMLYPNTVSFTFEELPQTNSTDTTVQINERGTIKAIIFDKRTFYNQLATEGLTEMNTGNVYISNPENLIVTLSNKDAVTSTFSEDISFSVAGNSQFVWEVDKEKIKQDLAGKARKNLGSVLSTYQAVDTATVMLSPFWKRSFPKNPDKIIVKVQGVD